MLRLRNFALLAALGLIAAVVKQELDKPAAERQWRGTLCGWLPYDFRPPTVERLRQAWWNPDEERIFTPHTLGIGWSVNLGRIAWLLGFDLPMASTWEDLEQPAGEALRAE